MRTPRARRAGRSSGSSGRAGLLALLPAGDQDDGAPEALHEPRRDDADDAAVPVLACNDVTEPALPRLRPLLDLAHRVAEDPLLDGLPVAVQVLELAREPLRLAGVLREEQVERGPRVAEPAGRVDARSQPEGDRAGVHGGRVDAGGAHERLQPRLVRSRQPHSRGHERAVLVQERNHVGHRGQRDEVEVAVEPRRRAPRAACRRRLCRTARGTGTRRGGWRRPGSRAGSRRAGGGR